MQSKLFLVNNTLNVHGKIIDLSIPKVMGILNVTPDSFFDGNRYVSPSSILKQVEKMVTEGADFIDVGGYSSRPGASEISMEEELSRVLPVIELIHTNFPQSIISIDTFRSQVAFQAVKLGAGIVNDISAGEIDNKMIETVAAMKVPYLAMHMRGTPQTMSGLTQYENLLNEVTTYFYEKIKHFQDMGIKDVMIDPGFGFAKTVDQNFELLNQLESLRMIAKPIVVGLSRKAMIWRTLKTSADYALNGTTALHAIALLKGACILRVHDVKEAVETIKLITKVDSPSLAGY